MPSVANINNDIRTWFYNRLLTGTTFKADISKVVGSTTVYRLYYYQAPQVFPGTTTPVEPPYVVMDILPISQDRDSASKFYSCTLQFLVSSIASIAECETIAGHITDLLEDCEASMSVGTYQVIKITREPQINLPQVDRVFNIAVQYSILIQK